MKKINCVLSGNSFRNAAKKIREYQDEIKRKCDEFTDELAGIGAMTVSSVLYEHVDTGLTVGSLNVEYDDSGYARTARVVVSSDAILFLEFGSGQGEAGVHAAEFGMGPGTYPGKGHWNDPNGWYYYDEKGKRRHSYGMSASMPMYQGGKAMEDAMMKIAKRVFK